MLNYLEWTHVFKLDPNKEISDADLEKICESGTDGIIVGGSDGVTLDNTLQLLARVRRYPVACALEVSTIDSITPGFDHYFIPSVLNSNEVKWVTGLHHQAVKEFGPIMNWDEIVMEGYCILNPESKAAKLTDANTSLTEEDVVAYARMAEHMYRFPIFYIEYSGVFGDPAIVKAAKDVLEETRLVYGGGITTTEQAREISLIADTVVVGNIIYDDLNAALATVKAVKE
ncbi:heptaprenylglyceryl phosphate synthase [Desertibacillus haloalkaliphilus]|uniref:heptaprenylglyceryl phosphate synthase n=1 Tax=Desertibacillus haloalkaliphilus TaxID=1328930 RepID=UPI001C261D83|nr:heptaprenylglyceryl phosphate synthase [Desertibacillus haloalkaliphilus]MBU8906400.1 heptaprenylglyceryl phosphate synthase [Desertibacillus haloalkaliphilus]